MVPQSLRTQAPLASCSCSLYGPGWLQEHQVSRSSPKSAYIPAKTALQEGPQKLLSTPLPAAPGSQLHHVTIFAGKEGPLKSQLSDAASGEWRLGWKPAALLRQECRSTVLARQIEGARKERANRCTRERDTFLVGSQPSPKQCDRGHTGNCPVPHTPAVQCWAGPRGRGGKLRKRGRG